MALARSLWHISPGLSQIRSEELLTIPSDAIFYSLYSLVSIGTERIISLREVPLELFQSMKVPYMGGGFELPVKYGYSLVVKDQYGHVFHLMHPHQNLISVDSSLLTAIPATIPPKRAVLISNLETIFNAFYDGMPQPTESIAIVGFGLIGALLGIWLRLKGFNEIMIIETDAKRLDKALSLGFKTLVPQDSSDCVDLIFHTTSTEYGLQYCINHMNLDGRIIDLSWYGNKRIQLTLGEKFHTHRITIKSSQVSHIPVSFRNSFDFKSRKQEVINMLNHEVWDKLVDMEITLEESVSWFEKIRKGNIDPLSLVIKY